MEPWSVGLVALLVVGVGVILAGALLDRRRTAKARAEMLAPPRRAIPRLTPEARPPAYLSELQARRAPAGAPATALTPAQRAEVETALHDPAAFRMAVGWARDTFVTDPATGWAVLDQPAVLVCAEPVTSVRELLATLEGAARTGGSVVIAAPSITPDVLATLEVNVIQRKLRLLAVTTDGGAGLLERIAAGSGAAPLARGDLQAGYVPADAVGRCHRWVATRRESFLLAGPVDPDQGGGG